MGRRNDEVARVLEHIAELLAVKGENSFRIRAYAEAARNVAGMTEDIEDIHRVARLEDIPGVGESIAAKIAEFLETGAITYYEDLKRLIPLAAGGLLEVPGIGPARAHMLHEWLGITDVALLQQAAEEHRLQTVPGFGPKLEAKIAREAARVSQRTRRLLLGTALPVAEEVVRLLRDDSAVVAIDPAGSIRRMKETIGDIDILVATEEPSSVIDAFRTLPIVKEVLSEGPIRPSILTRDDLQVDLRIVSPDEYGSALQYFTGSKDHDIALRSLAAGRGWKLSEYGLFDEAGQRIASATEQDVYAALGLDWIPPELRENGGEIEAARVHRLPNLVDMGNIRGDLHLHTDWSDGHDSLEVMVKACIARGYQYLAVADHSQSLRIAHGLTPDRVQAQRHLIDQLNERYAPFCVLQSAEVDILPNGDLDYPDDVLEGFDLVTASVHGHFDFSTERMTDRVIRAIRHPFVFILGHPTGRLLLRRPAFQINMEAIMRAARECQVALEVNGQPDRLDLDDFWSRRAQAEGVILVCNSDAHSSRQLAYMRYAVATARRGWIEPGNVLNTLPIDQLRSWLTRRRREVK